MTNTELNQGNDLCLSCGFCCDGTLFSHVTLQESEENKKRSNIELELVDGSYSFVQPCQALNSVQGCEVYADRPSMCQKFECDLLKDVKANKLLEIEALDKVEKAKVLKQSLKYALLEIDCPEQYLVSFREQIVYIESELSDISSLEQYKETYKYYSSLKSYLKDYFYKHD